MVVVVKGLEAAAAATLEPNEVEVDFLPKNESVVCLLLLFFAGLSWSFAEDAGNPRAVVPHISQHIFDTTTSSFGFRYVQTGQAQPMILCSLGREKKGGWVGVLKMK